MGRAKIGIRDSEHLQPPERTGPTERLRRLRTGGWLSEAGSTVEDRGREPDVYAAYMGPRNNLKWLTGRVRGVST